MKTLYKKVRFYFFQYYLACWTDLLVGLIGVLTFAMYKPKWDYTYRFWWSLKYLKERQAEDKDL